jgi:uncharacterized protein YpmB
MLRKRNIISIILFWVILIVLYEMISIVFSVNDSPSQMNVRKRCIIARFVATNFS